MHAAAARVQHAQPRLQVFTPATATTAGTRPAPQRPLLDAALEYAARGWTVIPTGRDKKAVGKWKKYQTARPDGQELRRLFSGRGITGLAVVLGSASGGLGCRDFDVQGAYECWAARHQDLAAALPTVQTARGRHVYFLGPQFFAKFDDGEYRGDAGHYCLLPPSRHPDGPLYRWVVPLPPGALPTVSDPEAAGLLAPLTPCENQTERTERTETDREDRGRQKEVRRQPGAGGSDSEIAAIIAATLPTREGERHHKIFELCRRLQGLPDVAADLDPGALRPVLAKWHELALPFIGTKDFMDSYADFIRGWSKVKYPAGHGKVEEIYERAAKSEPPREIVELYPGEEALWRLTSLCRELQREAGNADFRIDCRTAARLVGVKHDTAWRWLTCLTADRFIELREKGRPGKASRYRYLKAL
jgi:hypothetical protein